MTASHFEPIGFDVASADDLASVVDSVIAAGRTAERDDGGRSVEWEDPSGAAMIIELTADGAVECLTPTFRGRSRLEVRPLAFQADPDCRFCDLLGLEVLENGEMAYPLMTELDTAAAARPVIQDDKSSATVTLTAFAEQIAVFADEGAFDAGPESALGAKQRRLRLPGRKREDPPTFAPESLIPAGMFGDGPASAHALINGRLLEAEVRTNTLTGRRFQWATVQTFGGSYDMLAADADVPGDLQPGQIVQLHAWIVGRLMPK